ncbi:hypothetical protein [Pseudoalteromonas xiamenensis]|uniref:Solute-binding protein family 3/N-terminal domain-containing protein n=1 Tax=Pseudoalteromonas xiamenensis TaxID=882626 RepID=A0A975HM59_9GAMM|nr:hypothetical protein [Pseudoalteromonas xiamenensis]QTH70720.1 hypothetical protein J5O05_12410 [Pseudoalteromonas xiamenensis]
MTKFAICVLLGVIGGHVFAADEPPYTINISESVASPEAKDVIIKLLEALYARIDITPRFVMLPSSRGMLMVNSGELDAEAARVDTVAASYPNLVQVQTPLLELTVGYYCLKEQACQNFDEDTVFIVPKGSKLLTEFCDTHRLTCLPVNNDESAFKTIGSGVGDVLLSADWIARTVMCNSHYRTFYYRPEPTLATEVYHYVHRKHQSLLPQLDAAMVTLNHEGVIKDFIQNGMNSQNSCDAKIITLPSSAL